MTLERAARFVLPIGRHQGMTLAEVDAAGFRSYLEWGATQWDRSLGRAVRYYVENAAPPPNRSHGPTRTDRVATAARELAAAPPFNRPDDTDAY